MTRHKLWLLLGVVALILIAGIWQTQQQSRQNDIQIGAILPLTGNLALLGVDEQRGMDLAVEEINGTGGVSGRKLTVTYEDSKGESSVGVSAARKLIDIDQAKILFTSLTGVSHAVALIVVETGGLQVVFGMDEAIPAGRDGVFRIYPGIREEGQVLLKYAEILKPKRVAIIYFKQAALEAEVREVLEPGLRKLGVTDTTIEVFEKLDGGPVRDIISKVKAVKPDLVLLCAYYNQMPVLFKSLGEYGMLGTTKIAGGLNLENAVAQNLVAPELVEGVVAAVPLYSYHSEVDALPAGPAKAFVERHRAKYGKLPNLDAAYGYEAIKILAAAISTSGDNMSKLKAALKSIKDYPGVTGRVSLSDDGNARTSWQLSEYKAGKLVPLQTDKK